MPTPPWVLPLDVPEAVYTDREYFIERLVKDAYEAIGRRTMSTVLLGQRRMGKTEIFKRVVNRLFFEQDHTDPNAVIPVYYSFREEKVDRWEFSIRYVENFIRWYAAFRLRDPGILNDKKLPRHQLADYIRNNLEASEYFSATLNLLQLFAEKQVTIPEQVALETPRNVSGYEGGTIAMFLDEFQNTHLPQYNFQVMGFMKNIIKSLTCPHFVTGLPILGRGALFGRFMRESIERLTDYYGEELTLRAADYYHAIVSREMAPIVSERCGGNPFYITAVIRQAAKQGKALDSENALNEMLAVDLSSGFIWAELHDQLTRWIARINDYGISKWVLYLAALEEDDWIDVSRIQRELAEREGTAVTREQIQDVLVKLSMGDLLEYPQFGSDIRKINDPILNEFLKVWGRITVAGESASGVQDEVCYKYQRLQRRFADHLGYLAEVYMIQILWNCQGKHLPGRYLHSATDVKVPDRFTYIAHRSSLGMGLGMELDIYAAAGIEGWLAESKWWRDRKVGAPAVERLLAQAQTLQARREFGMFKIWLFAHDGVTAEAEALMCQHGVLWSERADLDALLKFANLRSLPE